MVSWFRGYEEKGEVKDDGREEKKLRTRDVMINTLDVRRGSGKTWLDDLNKAFMPCYPTTDGKAFDFPTLQWYHNGVAWCLKNKLMTNHKDGTFGVSETASRATIAEILWRLAGSPQAEEGGGFADVAADAWYAGAVDWAVENGVAAGRGDGTFGPEEPITREQLVCMLYCYAQSQGKGFTGAWMMQLDYPDAGSVSDWAYEAMCWMTMNGIINGKDGNHLDPAGQAIRAETAVMITRFHAAMEEQPAA